MRNRCLLFISSDLINWISLLSAEYSLTLCCTFFVESEQILPEVEEECSLDPKEQVYQDILKQHFVSLLHSSHCSKTTASWRNKKMNNKMNDENLKNKFSDNFCFSSLQYFVEMMIKNNSHFHFKYIEESIS